MPFASEPGLAVLIALRYVLPDIGSTGDDHVLGWTDVPAIPEPVPETTSDDAAIRAWVDAWLDSRRSLLARVRSKVLPEADVVLFRAVSTHSGPP